MRYTVGGTAFLVDETLIGLETDAFADGELTAAFVPPSEFELVIAREHRRVNGPAGLEGAVDPGTRQCWMPEPKDSGDRGWYLRQMAPVFGATLGHLVLHASAVQIGGVVVAFVGASGAGKSTTARFFAENGFESVADDLLPIRFEPVPVAPAGGHLLPLDAIYFIDRTTSGSVEAKRLRQASGLRRLITHGFGEHGDPATWTFQFDAYHRIIESTPTFDLAIPDDLAALPDLVNAVAKLTPTSAPSNDAPDTR